MKRYLLMIWLCAIHSLAHSQSGSSITEIKDLIYYSGAGHDDQKHRLNLVLPQGENPPLLLWIHGGAWSGGDRKHEMPLARKLAEDGIAVAVMSYRLSPAPPKKEGIQHPEHIRDVSRAFKWIYSKADVYGYDSNNLFVSGYSAGGHLSALLAMDVRYLEKEMLSFQELAGCIPISGAYDIPHYFQVIRNAYSQSFAEQHVNGVFGRNEGFIEASPVNYVNQLQVPMLVMTDGALSIYADHFKKTLVEHRRSDVRISYYEEFSHEDLYKNLLFDPGSKARKEIVEFVFKNTRS